MYNSMTILGHLGQDAETKQVGEHTVAKFSLATSNYKKETFWWHCDFWNPRGVLQYLKKGQLVLVVGEMSYREAKDKAGNDKTYYSLKVREVKLLGSKKDAAAKPEVNYTTETIPF